jgi:hypothetical protein
MGTADQRAVALSPLRWAGVERFGAQEEAASDVRRTRRRVGGTLGEHARAAAKASRSAKREQARAKRE